MCAGLDARAAAIVMKSVRNVGNNGRTVIVTIHQPSIEIFEAFDRWASPLLLPALLDPEAMLCWRWHLWLAQCYAYFLRCSSRRTVAGCSGTCCGHGAVLYLQLLTACEPGCPLQAAAHPAWRPHHLLR